MIEVGIQELKKKLSHYLLLVKQGEDLAITEQGEIIAHFSKNLSSSSDQTRNKIHELAHNGMIELRDVNQKPSKLLPHHSGGKSLSSIVIEDRK